MRSQEDVGEIEGGIIVNALAGGSPWALSSRLWIINPRRVTAIKKTLRNLGGRRLFHRGAFRGAIWWAGFFVLVLYCLH